jgi:hypothetical protein
VTSSNLPYIRYTYIPFSDGCSCTTEELAVTQIVLLNEEFRSL